MNLWERCERVVAPSALPVGLDLLREVCAIDGVQEDARLQAYLEEAVAAIDGPDGIGVAMLEQQWRLRLDRFEGAIPLPIGPVKEVVSLTYRDNGNEEQTVPPGAYQLARRAWYGLLEPVEAWPVALVRTDAVTVTWTAGWNEAAPELARLRAAICQQVAHRVAFPESSGVTETWSALVEPFRQRRVW